jgi:hypothetical protein
VVIARRRDTLSLFRSNRGTNPLIAIAFLVANWLS